MVKKKLFYKSVNYDSIIMIGAFPPPVHGMATINNELFNLLKKHTKNIIVFNFSTSVFRKSLIAELYRLQRFLSSFFKIALFRSLKGKTLYISISGGFGQFFEILYTILSRLKAMKIVMHHHSFAYIDRFNLITFFLTKIAGHSATHVVLSKKMSDLLKKEYNISRTISLSNAAFCPFIEIPDEMFKNELCTVGFLGNICKEKGIFDFIDLIKLCANEKLPIKGIIAGPFANDRIKNEIQSQIESDCCIKYIGPKYGPEKHDFFNNIDLLIFPSQYKNEAEPLVVLEALSHSVPVIAYDRGCISEVLGCMCGKVINKKKFFAPEACEHIKQWINDPNSFKKASHGAFHRFYKIHNNSKNQWAKFISGSIMAIPNHN